MTVESRFVDTNVLVYLFDADSPNKQARARELLREEADRIVVSVQVLGEFYVPMRRLGPSMPFAGFGSRRSIPNWCDPPCTGVNRRGCRTGTR